MKVNKSIGILALVFLVLSISDIALCQIPTAQTEVWPKLSATTDLRPKTRLQIFGGTQNGGDFQWNLGAMLSYRMKRMVLRQPDIDEENEHLLVLGAGYEYVQTIENGKKKRENRIIFQGTARYNLAAGFLATDRNRLEFRWVNGAYNFRYRNKLVIKRAFRINRFRLAPYASGELFRDRNRHSWNQNEYSFGVELPYQKRFMIDIFYLHQNCTTCNQQHVNVAGLTLNLYFKRK